MVDVDTPVRVIPVSQAPLPWRVVVHDDPYTPMHFVVDLFTTDFGKTMEAAYDLMMDVHEKGAASIGPFCRDVAETKAQAATAKARAFGHPLVIEAARA